MLLLRLPSLLRHPWGSVLVLSLLAITASQLGFELFYGARLYLGSVPVVLALLLLGKPGLLVGAASVLLVPRLWADPQVAVVQLAELLCLFAFLQHGDNRADRRERGDVILVDALFWVLIAIPIDFLLVGVIANVNLPEALDASLLRAINGVLNTTLAVGILLLIRIIQSRRHRPGCVSLQGLILISLLGLTLSAGTVSLAVGIRQLDQEIIGDHLGRFRQLALTSAVLESGALDDLAGLRRQQESPLDFQVLDRGGRVIYNSNPALFHSLEDRYVEPPSRLPSQPQVSEPLDLLIPVESRGSAGATLRGYWRYQTTDDQDARSSWPLVTVPERTIVVVEPARTGIRELQAQSSRAIRLLALLVLVAVIAARAISLFVVRQFPEFPVLQGFRTDDHRAASAAGPDSAVSSMAAESLDSGLRELQPLLQALRSRGDVLINLRESFRRSEHQRHRLEAEVGRLNIIDPLTGCFNRRELYRRLDHELRLSGREQRDQTFLCLEIDHLRQIHDSYGKDVYDEVLRRVALELRHRSRATDFLCRLDTEQFGLLLTGCNSASALKVAQLLRDVVHSLEICHEGSILAVTISVGVASLQPGRDDPDSLITRAQRALYRAKLEGRDRVVLA